MEDNEIFLKPVYKSKKDILNRILRLKTERDDNTSIISKIQNPHPIPKKYSNLTKKNLTYQNFLEYTYDYNNITAIMSLCKPQSISCYTVIVI